jgi:hypothetical protein
MMPNPFIRHLPATRLQYEDVLIDVSMYLGCAMLVFFALNWMTIAACESKKKQWVNLEQAALERQRTRDGASNVSDAMFDASVGTFLKVKAYLIGYLRDPDHALARKVNALFNRTLDEDALLANLRLSWYFRVNVDESLMLLMCCPWTTWLHLLCWYVLLTFLAACWMVTYVHVMCIVASVSGAILLAMYRTSRSRSRLIVDLQSATDVSGEADVSPKLHQKEAQRLHASHLSTWQVSTQTVMEGLRCSTLILVFGAAQFIGSSFCWKYYFFFNLAFCVGVVLFLLCWCFEMVYIIPAFAAANSLPPINGDDTVLQRHAEQIVASFQDDSERQFWEDKVETGRLSIAGGAILGHHIPGTASASQVSARDPSAVQSAGPPRN